VAEIIKKRGLGSFVFLGIITGGIYMHWRIYRLAKDVNAICEGDGKKTAGLIKLILLSGITFGIYFEIWLYMLGDRLWSNARKYDLEIKESGGTVLLWSLPGVLLFGIGPFIAWHILFKNTNELADAYNKRGGSACNGQKAQIARAPEDGFAYAENSGRITITKYEGQATDVVIPERINNLPVSAIGNGAFANKRLTGVSVPDSLMYIGVGAFANNLLRDVSVHQSATIGEGAFDANVKITRR